MPIQSRRLMRDVGALAASLILAVLGLLIPETQPYYVHWQLLLVGTAGVTSAIASLLEGRPGDYSVASFVLTLLSAVAAAIGIYYAFRAFQELLPQLPPL